MHCTVLWCGVCQITAMTNLILSASPNSGFCKKLVLGVKLVAVSLINQSPEDDE